jgi:hypothetical protein
MTKIVLDQVAAPFVGACYNKLSQRERTVVDFLLGIDVLEVIGNKITKRS